MGQLLALKRVHHRITSDLYDDMGQLGQRPARATGLLHQTQDSSRQILDALNDVVWTVNPAHDGLAGITAMMRASAAELLETTASRWPSKWSPV